MKKTSFLLLIFSFVILMFASFSNVNAADTSDPLLNAKIENRKLKIVNENFNELVLSNGDIVLKNDNAVKPLGGWVTSYKVTINHAHTRPGAFQSRKSHTTNIYNNKLQLIGYKQHFACGSPYYYPAAGGCKYHAEQDYHF